MIVNTTGNQNHSNISVGSSQRSSVIEPLTCSTFTVNNARPGDFNPRVKPKRATITHSRGEYNADILKRLKDGELFVDTTGTTGMWLGEADPVTGKVTPVQVAMGKNAYSANIYVDNVTTGADEDGKISVKWTDYAE